MSLAGTSLANLLRLHAEKNPDGVFARFNGEPITFAMLDSQSAALAAWLRSRGLQSGEHVAVMMRNSVETLAVVFGLAKAGLVWVPLNAQQRGPGLQYIVNHSKPVLVIADAEHLPTIVECGAEHPRQGFLVHGKDEDHPRLAEVLSTGTPFMEPAPAMDAPFAIMYTSGTTGQPKGVIVSNQMIRLAGEAVGLVAAARADDVMFVWEPLYHIGGAQLLGLPMTHGVVLAMVDRFSASRFWSQVREYRATHIHYLGGILQILLKQPPSPMDRDHGVRIAWGGGCPGEIWNAFQDRFGVQIRECYGMTEASSITTFNDKGVIGSVGNPVPWFTVELLGADGHPVPLGERGEIVVRTSTPGALFPGYFNNPDATEKALRNGALHTGDLGSYDPEGNLIFHGRMTDSVRCRGENVSAWEVERVAADHPSVEDCAMIGVAADVGEQDIKLFIKPKAGTNVEPAEISAWLSTRLASYQNPRYIAVVDEFERTPSQRIMKHKLSKRLDDCWDRLAQGI
ncbi:AMP-dependent synthetase [Microvirga vignae]|uniref:AMP-dependent synthetase n=1 Tax=Microvirga vignae TaxID=1225564 RepID=A0A0H1RFJ0_9HYPH|nr:AMP-binding protein [Microvirga vignae]KLK91347.1 AMP-dependent synthetase [Microvirga vignae]